MAPSPLVGEGRGGGWNNPRRSFFTEQRNIKTGAPGWYRLASRVGRMCNPSESRSRTTSMRLWPSRPRLGDNSRGRLFHTFPPARSDSGKRRTGVRLGLEGRPRRVGSDPACYSDARAESLCRPENPAEGNVLMRGSGGMLTTSSLALRAEPCSLGLSWSRGTSPAACTNRRKREPEPGSGKPAY